MYLSIRSRLCFTPETDTQSNRTVRGANLMIVAQNLTLPETIWIYDFYLFLKETHVRENKHTKI